MAEGRIHPCEKGDNVRCGWLSATKL